MKLSISADNVDENEKKNRIRKVHVIYNLKKVKRVGLNEVNNFWKLKI